MSIENKYTIASGAVVCKEITLKGEITIGSGTVVHPTAMICATNGPIIIGENNNIEETVLIENLNEDGETLIIGRDNVFEIGCVVQARAIGDNNVFGARCHVGPRTTITRGCSIGTNCKALLKETLPENTVIFGEHNIRRTARDPPQHDYNQASFLVTNKSVGVFKKGTRTVPLFDKIVKVCDNSFTDLFIVNEM